MRTYFLLSHLLSKALVAVHDRARAFPLDSSIPIGTTSLEIEHEYAAQGRLGELSQTKELKHSPSRDVQHQNIDHIDARKGNLVAKHSEPTTLPKSSTERSVDLYALRVPLYDQEGYMAIFLSNETAVTFCKDVSGALYDDSEKVFLHLDLRLGNSTTEIPVREDNAIGFCQKVKRKEQVVASLGVQRLRRAQGEVRLRGRPRLISRLSRALQSQHLLKRVQSLPRPLHVKLQILRQYLSTSPHVRLNLNPGPLSQQQKPLHQLTPCQISKPSTLNSQAFSPLHPTRPQLPPHHPRS
jgi:hypothetical protein